MDKKEKIIATSKFRNFNIGLIVFGMFFFGFVIYMSFSDKPNKTDYEDHIQIAVIIAYLLFLIYCLNYLFNLKIIIIYKDFIIIKKIISTKKYYYKDFITYWNEFKEGKYNSWTEYTFIMEDSKKIKLLDSEYSNFYSFIHKITKKVKQNEVVNQNLNKKRYLKYSIISLLISGIAFYFVSYFYVNDEIKNNEIIYISNKLQSDIKYVKGRRGNQHLEFQLKKYPILTFKVSNFKIKSSIRNIKNDFKQNNEIIVGINKNEYDKKIAKNKPLNFIDKYFHYTTIYVDQIRNTDGMNYIDLIKYNSLNNENNIIGVFFFAFAGLLFLILAIGNYRAYLNDDKWVFN